MFRAPAARHTRGPAGWLFSTAHPQQPDWCRCHFRLWYYNPFQRLLNVVCVQEVQPGSTPVAPFPSVQRDPDMTPQQVYPICRNRLGIGFSFRDAKQHLCLTAYRACTGTRYHFHAKDMPEGLAQAWWGMCQAAGWAVPIGAEGDQSKPVFP